MSRQAEEHIPADVLYAAKGAGLKTPLWYAGRSNGHEGKQLEQTLDEMIEAPYREAGREVPKVRRKAGDPTTPRR
jgi:hypothetical protein